MHLCLDLLAQFFKNYLAKRKGMALMWLGALFILNMNVVKKVEGNKMDKVFPVHTMKAYNRIVVLGGGES